MENNSINGQNTIIDGALGKINWEELDLGWKNMNDSDIQYLVQHNLGKLKILNLIGNNLTSLSVDHLLRTKFNNLKSLYLNYNNIRSKGCKLLSKGAWHFLQVLSLDSCSIQNSGILHLGKAKWEQLKVLSLNQNAISTLDFSNIARIEAPLKKLQVAFNLLSITSCYNIIILKSQLESFNLFEPNSIEDIQQLFKLKYLLRKRFASYGKVVTTAFIN